MSAASSSSLSGSKFRGCLVGALLGDCLGAPLEFITDGALSRIRVNQQMKLYFNKHGKSVHKKAGKYRYTDDTAMAKQIAGQLIESGDCDPPHLAAKFVREAFNEPYRGYGGAVISVFGQLREQMEDDGSGICADFNGPAGKQFGGSGSYGNGAAMRIHPLALAACGREDREWMFEQCENAAKITHTNPLGVEGALLQVYSVLLALTGGFRNATEFVGKLHDLAESKFAEESPFKEALRNLEECLKSGNNDEAYYKLGNDVSALKSVPPAIYSFLKHHQHHRGGSEAQTAFVDTLKTAFGFGGDTDTIGCMAAAMAGAYHGYEAVPKVLREQCEAAEEMLELADKLHEKFINRKSDDSI